MSAITRNGRVMSAVDHQSRLVADDQRDVALDHRNGRVFDERRDAFGNAHGVVVELRVHA